jgi:hypothetical protein
VSHRAGNFAACIERANVVGAINSLRSNIKTVSSPGAVGNGGSIAIQRLVSNARGGVGALVARLGNFASRILDAMMCDIREPTWQASHVIAVGNIETVAASEAARK